MEQRQSHHWRITILLAELSTKVNHRHILHLLENLFSARSRLRVEFSIGDLVGEDPKRLYRLSDSVKLPPEQGILVGMAGT